MLSPSLESNNAMPTGLPLVGSFRHLAAAAPPDVLTSQPRLVELLHGIGKDRLEKAHRTVREITRRHSIYLDKTPPEAGKIRHTFLRLAPMGMQAVAEQFNTLRRVHKLAWSLGYREAGQPAVIQTPFLELALDLIGQRFRDGMLLGLFDALLKCWQAMDVQKRQAMGAFIGERIKHYTGKRICLHNICLHAPYYTCQEGAAALGEMLCKTRGELSKVWQFLELPDHVKGYGYFSEAALAYLDLMLQEERLEETVPDLIKFLGSHRNDDTVKKCLTRIILALGEPWNLQHANQLQVAALQLIGDPADESCWRPWDGATREEVSDFQTGRQTLRRWISARLIDFFYENFTREDAKKRFWLNYTDHFAKVRVFCSSRIYDEMSRDEQMSAYARSYFGVIRGARGDEVALVLKIRSHFLIEAITEQPAFFACLEENRLLTGIEAGSIQLSDLNRLNAMEPFLHRQGENVIKHKQEGKITDGGVRSSFLPWWLRHHLGV